MTAAIPFAGLAPDARPLRGRGDLSSFDVQSALEIGRELRALSERSASTHELAGLLVDAMNAFELDRRAACVLVRVFVTRRFAELPSELQAVVEPRALEPERACLQLMATRGIEPEWDDERRSQRHRALLRDGEAAPMVAEIEAQLRVDDPRRPATATFYIADAAASPAVPAKDFVRAYGVHSVFGFGARAWPGETIVFIGFCRSAVGRKTLLALGTVARYARAAWLGSIEARAQLDPVALARARSDSAAELVAGHELALRESLVAHRADVAAARADALALAEKSGAEVERHNADLRRIQRAMLNVIEDLRDAREALASKVEQRTRELAAANRQLEARNRELEEFVYIASHDLQEPLRTVSGYLQMIERRYAAKLGKDGDEFIHFAIEGAQRMQALIESLLLYSRITTAERNFERVALQEPLESALRNLALRIEETHADIVCGPLPEIRGDRMQMVQLFQNLIANALKFAGDRPPRVELSAHVDGRMCMITVRDHGIGFPAKFVDRIFKVFRRLRRDTEGTGIGLAVCKKIVERHGGRISAVSAPGQGATFTVELALEPEQHRGDTT